MAGKTWVLDTSTKGTGANVVPLERTATPLPAGHVRKRATGEIGKVQALDAQAGTVTVRWLKRGATSTVPLSSVSRR